MTKYTDPTPTYSERIVFTDGDHVTLTVEDPNYVEVRGRIAGETFDISLRSDAAAENGHLLVNGTSPDALWNLEPGRARRFGHALIGAAAAARDAAPFADSPQGGTTAGAQRVPTEADLFPHSGEDTCYYCGRFQTDEQADSGRTIEHVTSDLLAVHRTSEALKAGFSIDHPAYAADIFDLLCDLDAASACVGGDEHAEASERIPLNGGRAYVEVPGDHVELTVTLGERVAVGLALSTTEAARIGAALTAAAARADARTLQALAVSR